MAACTRVNQLTPLVAALLLIATAQHATGVPAAVPAPASPAAVAAVLGSVAALGVAPIPGTKDAQAGEANPAALHAAAGAAASLVAAAAPAIQPPVKPSLVPAQPLAASVMTAPIRNATFSNGTTVQPPRRNVTNGTAAVVLSPPPLAARPPSVGAAASAVAQQGVNATGTAPIAGMNLTGAANGCPHAVQQPSTAGAAAIANRTMAAVCTNSTEPPAITGRAASEQPTGDTGSKNSDVVVLLHFNDWHIRMEPCTDWTHALCDKWQDQKGSCGGGIARMKAAIDAERAKAAAAGQPLLLLNAGDDFIGTVWDRKLGLDAPAHFLSLLKPDVMAVGNHEWDRGKDQLEKYLQKLSYPALACNLDFGGDDLQRLVKPYYTRVVGGHKICILGVTTQYIDDMDIRPIYVQEPISSAQKCVKEMRQRENCSAVILLTHIGYSMDVYMAPRIPGVDLIVGGHSHSFLWSGGKPPVYDTDGNKSDAVWGAYPTWVDSWSDKNHKVAVVQAGWGSRWLGRLELKFGAQSGKLEGITGYPMLMGGKKSDRPVEEDAGVKKEVADWRYW